MSFKNKNGFLLNVLLWAGLYVLWVFVFQNRTLTFSRTLGIELCYLVFIAFNFYFNIYFAIPKYLNRRRYFLFALFCFLFLIVTSWMRAEVVLFINYTFYNIPPAQINFTKLYFDSLLNIFIWTECLVAGKMIFDKLKFQRYAESIEKEKVLNELNFLRAQNNPHFLFNSLNSIYFQIDKSNKDARESLMRLSEMLRYQLYECTVEKISIDREIAYLRNYIELQKLRLNKNYDIFFNSGLNVKSFAIAPLLIMPLIENAFKYVSHFSDKSNEIKMDLSVEKNLFVCRVTNTIEKAPAIPAPSEGGIGLKNLIRRLELLYPGKHELNIDNNETQYIVKLTLNTNEN